MTENASQAPAPEKPSKGGAPLGNRNAMRHGMRGSSLPKGSGHILRATNEFRQALERAVLEARGEITLIDAARISTAFRSERHAQLCQRWLAKEAEKMSPADRLSYSREVVRASESRDRAIAALTMRPPDQEPLTIILPPEPPESPQTPPEPLSMRPGIDTPQEPRSDRNASDAAPGAQTP